MKQASYLGRGYESVPGQPFGWAWHRERDEIRDHLKRRGRWRSALDEFSVTRIQQRLHRNKPSFAERHAAWRARQPAPRPPIADELIAALREIAAGHNDARGRAAEALEKAGLA